MSDCHAAVRLRNTAPVFLFDWKDPFSIGVHTANATKKFKHFSGILIMFHRAELLT